MARTNEESDFEYDVGEWVDYLLPDGREYGGIIADAFLSPLTGDPRYRIVDRWSEAKDEHTGLFVTEEKILGLQDEDDDDDE